MPSANRSRYLVTLFVLSAIVQIPGAHAFFDFKFLKCLTALKNHVKPRDGLTDAQGRLLSEKVQQGNSAKKFWIWGFVGDANERMVGAVDPEIDKSLFDWVENNTHDLDLKNVEAINELANRVNATFWKTDDFKVHQAEQKIYDRLTGGSNGSLSKRTETVSKLGDFIANATGVCRHQSFLAAIVLQMNGIEARVITGQAAIKLASGEIDSGSVGGHAWLEVILNGQTYVLDPINQIPLTPTKAGGIFEKRFFSKKRNTDVTAMLVPNIGEKYHPFSEITLLEIPTLVK